jgi:hypothetical protein
MNFSEALEKAKSGRFIDRESWNGKDQYVFIREPLETDVGTPTVKYFMIKNTQGDLVPWVPSSGDLFADDWLCILDEDMRIEHG